MEERECGTAVRFQCPYHAWIYDLDGRLIRAKHTEDLEDFSHETSGLTPIRAGTWGGWVFLCFDDATPGLEAYLGDWFEHHAGFGRDIRGSGAPHGWSTTSRELEDRGGELLASATTARRSTRCSTG